MDKSLLINFMLSFILDLYGNVQYPRKLVQQVISHMSNFIKNSYLSSLQDDIKKLFKKIMITAVT